ncbi:pentapeptide repeat-containing protein [Microbacterium sp. NPDC064584]|uniref:pentapeptide repeat-containing protein n=1 Tax=Microbacterium sp. NPDC064584 TaxID=3155817 RepID=UPI003448931D
MKRLLLSLGVATLGATVGLMLVWGIGLLDWAMLMPLIAAFVSSQWTVAAVCGALIGLLALQLALPTPRRRRNGRRRRTRWVVTSLVVVVLVLILAIWFIPPLLADWDAGNTRPDAAERLSAVTASRQALLLAAGGLLAIVTLTFTWRRDVIAREGADLDRDANFTERYTEAIKQLGDGASAIRLGGVYALERIAKDSVRDRQTILDVLEAFIREQSPSTRPGGDLPTELQAAIVVLGRITRLSPPEHPLYLGFSSLYAGDLRRADFRDATLHQSVLIGAQLQGIDLRKAKLHGAKMQGAYLGDANLEGASFYRAVLSSADLRGSNLRSARLEEADLRAAQLDGADLTDADMTGALVTVDSLVGVTVSPGTKNPTDAHSGGVIDMQSLP